MSITSFSHVIDFFKRGDAGMSEADQKALMEEALLLTLSRATSADCNIDSVEVETVQTIMKEVAGADISCQEIRVAAISDVYKEASLERYLGKMKNKLTTADRQLIASSLGRLIRVDGKVSPFEVEFFNSVVTALALTPAQLAGLDEDIIRV